jgi:CRISPR/Cas system-associated endonuclease Cas1
LEVLRGFEGQGAALYFGQLGKLIRNPAFHFTGRTRRPPRDPVNALLSFGYAVWGSIAETEVYRRGLDPMLGFLHQPAYGRPSLMLDLLEEFRPRIDTLVLRVINRRQLGEDDFEQRAEKTAEEILAEPLPAAEVRSREGDEGAEFPWDEPLGLDVPRPASDARAERTAGQPVHGSSGGDPNGRPGDAAQADPCEALADGSYSAVDRPAADAAAGHSVVGVYLNDVGRKIFLNELFGRLRDRLYYPPRDATLELREIMRQQLHHLARVIERKDETYVPFASE